MLAGPSRVRAHDGAEWPGWGSLRELIATRNRSVSWRAVGIDPVLYNAGVPADRATG